MIRRGCFAAYPCRKYFLLANFADFTLDTRTKSDTVEDGTSSA